MKILKFLLGIIVFGMSGCPGPYDDLHGQHSITDLGKIKSITCTNNLSDTINIDSLYSYQCEITSNPCLLLFKTFKNNFYFRSNIYYSPEIGSSIVYSSAEIPDEVLVIGGIVKKIDSIKIVQLHWQNQPDMIKKLIDTCYIDSKSDIIDELHIKIHIQYSDIKQPVLKGRLEGEVFILRFKDVWSSEIG